MPQPHWLQSYLQLVLYLHKAKSQYDRPQAVQLDFLSLQMYVDTKYQNWISSITL